MSDGMLEIDEVQEECLPAQTDIKKLLKRKEFSCPVCGKDFSYRYGLLLHEKRRHPVWFDSKHKNDPKYPCDMCRKQFLQPISLLRHKRVIHEKREGRKTFHCHVCPKHFSSNGSLKRHLHSAHNIDSDKKKKRLKCSECLLSFPFRDNFSDHIAKSHKIAINVENLHFHTDEDFNKWKTDIEKSSCSKFIKCASWKFSEGKRVINFVCHRNGHYQCKSNGIRRSRGTYKIEYFCPANIFVYPESSENLFPANVKYCSTHLGHKCEVEMLPSKEKAQHKKPAVIKPPGVDSCAEDFNIDVQTIEIVSEEESKRNNYQNEARNAVSDLLKKLDRFSSEEQCTDIKNSISKLLSRCEAREKK